MPVAGWCSSITETRLKQQRNGDKIGCMRIQVLRKYRNRNPHGYFQDLPADVRSRAWQWLGELLERRKAKGKQTPRWTFALLVAQAKRLALNPPTSAWGRSMAAKKGGHAVQRKYRAEGRHPTAKATQVRLSKLRAQEQASARRESEQQARKTAQAYGNLARWTSH